MANGFKCLRFCNQKLGCDDILSRGGGLVEVRKKSKILKSGPFATYFTRLGGFDKILILIG